MTAWIHLLVQTASVVSLFLVRLPRAQWEALSSLNEFAASGSGPLGSFEDATAHTRNSITKVGHV